MNALDELTPLIGPAYSSDYKRRRDAIDGLFALLRKRDAQIRTLEMEVAFLKSLVTPKAVGS